jgi:hypothetical protein
VNLKTIPYHLIDREWSRSKGGRRKKVVCFTTPMKDKELRTGLRFVKKVHFQFFFIRKARARGNI